MDSDTPAVTAGQAPPAAGATTGLTGRFDPARLRWPEWVVVASALVLLIVMFVMKWFEFNPPNNSLTGLQPDQTVDGWHGVSHLRWLLLVTVIAALALFLLQATRRAPALPSTFSLLVTLLGGASAAWLIFRVAIDPPGGRLAGGWVGLVAAAALTWGAFRSLKMEGISPTDAPAHIPTVRLAPPEAPPPPPSADSPPSADRS